MMSTVKTGQGLSPALHQRITENAEASQTGFHPVL